jgi:hypothetical protein
MALYGSQRDFSLIRHINRELIGDIISQQCAYYKLRLEETKVNIYGEAAGAKYYHAPVLLSAIIDHKDEEYPDDEFGVRYYQNVDFKFLRDDLLARNLEYSYGGDDNIINPGLQNFGRDISIICKTHYQPADKVQIEKARING